MDKELLMSISVVTFNQKDFIKQCLDGILMQQTDFNFEIILGEDESNDGTREICIEYANKYPDKIKLFLRSRKDVIFINGNATGRFNMIENLKACQGKYIALCEGDDYWNDPLKLQKQVDFMEANLDYNICFHDASIYNQNTHKIDEDALTRDVSDTTSVMDLVHGNYIHTPTVVFRNGFKLPHWFKKSPLGDWTLYMLIVKDGKIKKLNDTMAVYRVHSDSLWSSKSQKERNQNTYITMRLLYKYVDLSPVAKQILKDSLLINIRVHSRFYRLKRSLFNKFKRTT